MRNTAFALCLLLCFPVAGKEKDEVASKKGWLSKKKIICAGALSALAMALLQSRPKTYHAPKTSDFPASERPHYSSLLGNYTDEESMDAKTILGSFFDTLNGRYKKKSEEHYGSPQRFWNKGLLKKCNDALEKKFGSFCEKKWGDELICHLFHSSISLPLEDWSVEVYNLYKHLDVNRPARSISSIPLTECPTDEKCIRICLKNKRQSGEFCDIKFSWLETQFLRSVVSQKFYLLHALTEVEVKSLVSYPALTCLQYCLSKKGQESDSRVELPAELLQIVKEYACPTFALPLPKSFSELQNSNSIMRLGNREDFDRFLDSYRIYIGLYSYSYGIRAVGPDGKEITVD